jgi:hypothetical protein
MKAVVHARVLGRDKTRTPSGEPIMISTTIFDDSLMSPREAIARRVSKTHGAVPYLPDWKIIATYDVRPDPSGIVEHGKPLRAGRAQFDVVYIAEYLADRPMRSHLGINDACLDPMVDSWYLTKKSS